MKYKIVLGTIGMLIAPAVLGQNITSPYSVLGIGDIDTKDAGRYFFAGSSSLARRDPGTYNFSNPASLSGLSYKTILMDVAMRGKVSKFLLPGEDTTSSPTRDLTIKRISLAFKVGERTGMAFGLRSYSSVNYLYRDNLAILDGNTAYTKYIEGNGGINQVYFSMGRALSKNFSAGITTALLFGALQRTTNYVSTDIELDIAKEERDLYTGAFFTGGLQYQSYGNTWKHQIGITGTITTGLKGQLTTTYYDAGYLIKKTLEDDREFKLPLSAGIGYSAIRKDKIVISAEVRYDHWKRQQVNYNRSYTAPAVRLSGGMEFLFKNPRSNNPSDRPYIGFGLTAENSYLRIRNSKLWDHSVTFGGGFSLTRNFSAYTGIELGEKGRSSLSQIKEKYTQFVLGIHIKDIWLGTKKFGRFD
jgi:hypothetical protein